jgi:hypothetical protein
MYNQQAAQRPSSYDPFLQPMTPDMHSGRRFINLVPSKGELILPIRGERVIKTTQERVVEDEMKEKAQNLQKMLEDLRASKNYKNIQQNIAQQEAPPVQPAGSRYDPEALSQQYSAGHSAVVSKTIPGTDDLPVDIQDTQPEVTIPQEPVVQKDAVAPSVQPVQPVTPQTPPLEQETKKEAAKEPELEPLHQIPGIKKEEPVISKEKPVVKKEEQEPSLIKKVEPKKDKSKMETPSVKDDTVVPPTSGVTPSPVATPAEDSLEEQIEELSKQFSDLPEPIGQPKPKDEKTAPAAVKPFDRPIGEGPKKPAEEKVVPKKPEVSDKKDKKETVISKVEDKAPEKETKPETKTVPVEKEKPMEEVKKEPEKIISKVGPKDEELEEQVEEVRSKIGTEELKQDIREQQRQLHETSQKRSEKDKASDYAALKKQISEIKSKLTDKSSPESAPQKKAPKPPKGPSGAPKATGKPNVISGLVKNSNGKVLENVLMLVKNEKGDPVRAIKTNAIGQFVLSTPLANGLYTIEINSANIQGQSFDIISVELKGKPVAPVEIIGKSK